VISQNREVTREGDQLSTAAKKYGPASRDRLGTQAAKTPKLKPAKAAEKQRTQPPSLQASSNWDEEHFEGQLAAMQVFLEELQNETSRCEQAAAEAIRLGEYDQKLPALNSWLEEWKNALCASASTHYYNFFKIALSHRDRLDGKKPADFAYGLTTKVMSLFLGIGALDAKEIDFNDQVREFIQHACEDRTNVAGGPSSVAAFQLPPWASRRSFGDKIGRSNSEYAETFVLEAAANLTSGLRSVLSRARRRAVIETAHTPAQASTITSDAKRPNVIWPGTIRQLGDEVIERYHAGGIVAKNEADALEKACAYFIGPNGRSFKAASIRQNLRNRKVLEQKDSKPRPPHLVTLVKRFSNVTAQKHSI
jgi:hypothetical protein